jgi:hypothetical protein
MIEWYSNGIIVKRRGTAKEIGIALLQIPGADPSCLTENLSAGVDCERVRDEIGYLKTWAVDYVTWASLGNSPETKAILDAYYSQLKSNLHASVYNTIYNRIELYANAVNTPHQNGPAWTIGHAFAILSSHEFDIEMILLGSIVFVNTVELVSGFVKSCQIVV